MNKVIIRGSKNQKSNDSTSKPLASTSTPPPTISPTTIRPTAISPTTIDSGPKTIGMTNESPTTHVASPPVVKGGSHKGRRRQKPPQEENKKTETTGHPASDNGPKGRKGLGYKRNLTRNKPTQAHTNTPQTTEVKKTLNVDDFPCLLSLSQPKTPIDPNKPKLSWLEIASKNKDAPIKPLDHKNTQCEVKYDEASDYGEMEDEWDENNYSDEDEYH